MAKSKDKLGKLQDQMNGAGYQDNVNSEIKDADGERLRNLTAEVETLDSFVESLRNLTLS